MNREDIIRMAREAWLSDVGAEILRDGFEVYTCIDDLERFAALVAAAEREACARVLDEMAAQDKLTNYYGVAANAIRARGQA